LEFDMLVNVTVRRSVGAYKKGAKIPRMPEYYAQQLVAMGIASIDVDGQEEEVPRKKRAYKRRDLTAE